MNKKGFYNNFYSMQNSTQHKKKDDTSVKKPVHMRNKKQLASKTQRVQKTRIQSIVNNTNKTNNNESKRNTKLRKKPSSGSSNLNSIKQIKAGGIICNSITIPLKLEEKSVSKNVKCVELYTNNIQYHNAECIREHGKHMILGCIAWFSNEEMLTAIAETTRRCLFVVNDEDYSSWTAVLRRYERLPAFEKPLHEVFSHLKDNPLNALDRDSKGRKLNKCSFSPVRAYGNSILPGSGTSNSNSSLMHNKYMIFFKQIVQGGKYVDIPYAVLTGSFNATKNATQNLENSVFIEDDAIAARYLADFSIIFMHSRVLRC